MFKIFAISLLMSPIIIFGFYQSYKESFRLKDLNELNKALNIFKNEISYSNKTIDESFYSISNKVAIPIATIFFEISKRLKIDTDTNFEIIFEEVTKKYSKYTYLTDRDIEEFISLANTINDLDSSSIISSINIFIEYIKCEISQLEKTSRQSKKTGQSLTVLSAILIVIILL